MKTAINKCCRFPRHFHPEKRGIRIFGIAESFNKSNLTSTLGGVVMRRDLIIDGIVFGTSTLKGDDSTKNIHCMFRSLERDDINCILLDGLIISMYNIIDGKQLNTITGLPVIAITFEDSAGLEEHIRHHFLEKSEMKLEQYRKLGNRDKVRLKTDKLLYIRYWGLSLKGALNTLNAFTLQGSIPEPIRVAKLLARAHKDSI
ncbi:MAG TPA: DUF99 family protein [Nitrososphaeraceae archaeon]|jgi:uncharacterized protein|nr:DUF99 family protein [Nitrososphaeraceae archaeon]